MLFERAAFDLLTAIIIAQVTDLAGGELRKIACELDELVGHATAECLLFIRHVDRVKRSLDIGDGDAYESTRFDIVECLEHDGYRIGFGNHKGCSTDLVIERLLGRKANAAE